jgi:hypothetical protein
LSNPAAIKATFSDFRLIKSRKIAQVILELPIEEGDKALEALGGLPRPDREAWVGIARLNVTSIKPQEKRRWHDLKLAAQASIRCTEPIFRRFIQDEHNVQARDEEQAAKFVRRYCGVKSRSELNLDPNCAEAWERLESKYQAWLSVPRHA